MEGFVVAPFGRTAHMSPLRLAVAAHLALFRFPSRTKVRSAAERAICTRHANPR